jgi:hypothetical protein
MLKVGLLAAGLVLCAGPALAQSVNAKLVCGPNSADPAKLRSFQSIIRFTLSAGRLEGTHTFSAFGGSTETFLGLISSEGRVQLSGQGSDKSGGAWTYEFASQRGKNKDTLLKGKRVNTLGIVGERECTMRFMRERPAI